MKGQQLDRLTRVLLLLCSIGLLLVLLVPLWRIDLDAPQYPEGLRLLIYPHGLGGNVDIINGLNHYIGMRTLHTADFIEFRILPIVIVVFAILLLLASFFARRKGLIGLTLLFILFGIVAMVDFWKWEYDYGHNLNPEAAIVVPGMAYQPPLIGYKQLLNFAAWSVPDTGGWIFLAVGLTLFLLSIRELLKYRKTTTTTSYLLAFFAILLASCNTASEPIRIGKDHCGYCKMLVTDPRFGAELVTGKGKVYKFDDIACLQKFRKEQQERVAGSDHIYLTDFNTPHALFPAQDCFLLECAALRTPMSGNIAAFSNADSLKRVAETCQGVEKSGKEILSGYE